MEVQITQRGPRETKNPKNNNSNNSKALLMPGTCRGTNQMTLFGFNTKDS